MSVTREKKLTARKIAALRTRQKLFDTAQELFEQHGFDTVTVEDITTAANVSKGTFYVYFENKETLITEMFSEIDDYYNHTIQTFTDETTMGERIMLLVDAMVDFCVNFGIDALRVVYCNQIAQTGIKILADKNYGIYKGFKNAVQRGEETGELQFHMDQDMLVESLVSQCRSLIYDWCLYNGDFDIHEEARRRFRTIVYILSSVRNIV